MVQIVRNSPPTLCDDSKSSLPAAGVVDHCVVRLEQLQGGEASHLVASQDHPCHNHHHSLRSHRDSGKLVSSHVDLGDDDAVVVLEVLAQLVPDGGQLLAVATPGCNILMIMLNIEEHLMIC